VKRLAVFAALAIVVAGAGFSRSSFISHPLSIQASLAGAPSAGDSIEQERARVRFFEERLARDPMDIDILNRLSVLYLQRLRETGSFADLALASHAAATSLRTVPAVRNEAGLLSRAMAEFSSHEFAATRDDAKKLLGLDGTGTAYALLGDAYSELGEYSAADNAYHHLRRAVGESDENVATRRDARAWRSCADKTKSRWMLSRRRSQAS